MFMRTKGKRKGELQRMGFSSTWTDLVLKGLIFRLVTLELQWLWLNRGSSMWPWYVEQDTVSSEALVFSAGI